MQAESDSKLTPTLEEVEVELIESVERNPTIETNEVNESDQVHELYEIEELTPESSEVNESNESPDSNATRESSEIFESSESSDSSDSDSSLKRRSIKTSILIVLTEEWTTEKKKTNHKTRNVQTKVQRHLVLEDGNYFEFFGDHKCLKNII
jgi:uncharacterized protein YjaG (DUF416 family)